MSPVTAIGLMSGTSMTASTSPLSTPTARTIGQFGPTGYRPYADDDRALLRRAMAAAANLSDRTARPGVSSPRRKSL